MKAKDRQSKFGLDPYFHPTKLTIPQTNYGVGYFISDKWSVGIKCDHMKYVMMNEETSSISGEIGQECGTQYTGDYKQDQIILEEDLLTFEHTDGLNYVFVEGEYNHLIFQSTGKFDFSLLGNGGWSIGALIPKTNTCLLGNERYDQFHLSGYGTAAKVGLTLRMFKWLEMRSEVRSGYINMPDIRTTKFETDRASQSFGFVQVNFLIGGTFYLSSGD